MWDGPGSLFWFGEFKQENKFAKKLAKKIASAIK